MAHLVVLLGVLHLADRDACHSASVSVENVTEIWDALLGSPGHDYCLGAHRGDHSSKEMLSDTSCGRLDHGSSGRLPFGFHHDFADQVSVLDHPDQMISRLLPSDTLFASLQSQTPLLPPLLPVHHGDQGTARIQIGS